MSHFLRYGTLEALGGAVLDAWKSIQAPWYLNLWVVDACGAATGLHSRQEWSMGDKKTSAVGSYVAKMVSFWSEEWRR